MSFGSITVVASCPLAIAFSRFDSINFARFSEKSPSSPFNNIRNWVRYSSFDSISYRDRCCSEELS